MRFQIMEIVGIIGIALGFGVSIYFIVYGWTAGLRRRRIVIDRPRGIYAEGEEARRRGVGMVGLGVVGLLTLLAAVTRGWLW